MNEDKDIRYSEKKVDESWKENASREKNSMPRGASTDGKTPHKNTSTSATPQTSKAFLNLINSLGLQAMIHLGEIPNPETQIQETNLQAAREIIDILVMLREKTQGNVSPDEARLLSSLLPEIQMKFSEKV
jgi:hypothetical protein